MLNRSGSVAGVFVIAVIGIAACSEQDAENVGQRSLCPSLERQAKPPTRAGLVVLDSTGQLTRFSVPGARALTTRRFPAPTSSPDLAGTRLALPGHYLAEARSAAEVVMLQRRVAPANDSIAVLDGRTLRPRCRYPLENGVRYRAVVTTDDRLIALGNRSAGEKKNAALYTVIDPAGGSPQTHVVRPPSNDWFIESGAVAESGQDLVLAYHGSDTTGADLVKLDDTERKPTSVPSVHGSVLATADSFIATTGSGLVRIDSDTGATEDLDPRAEGVHLMNFALNGRGSAAYVGACGDHPSVNRLDLVTRELEVVPIGKDCGELLGVASGRYAALAVAPGAEGEIVDPEASRLIQIDLEAVTSSKPLGRASPLAVMVEVGDPNP